MKTYNNGQRKGMMYGGGAMMRKPMNMGGLAETNRKTGVGQDGMMNPMGSMTDKKKFSMGMMYGGKTKKPKMAYKAGGLVGKQSKLDMNKDGKISGEDFKRMK